MTDPEPRRWIEDQSELDDPLREIVRAAADGRVDPSAVNQLRARLGPVLSPPPSTPPPGSGAVTTGAFATKTALPLALIATVICAVVLLSGPPRETGSGSIPPLTSTTGKSSTDAKPDAEQPAEELAPRSFQAVMHSPQSPDRAVARAHPQDPSLLNPSARGARPRSQQRRARMTNAQPPSATPRPTPSPGGPPSPSGAVSTSHADEGPTPDPFALETMMLARAQRLLSAEPALALAITEEHRRRFPDGLLTEEREAHAIDALSRLGRQDEALGRARTFQARYPRSGYRARVQASQRRAQVEPTLGQ